MLKKLHFSLMTASLNLCDNNHSASFLLCPDQKKRFHTLLITSYIYESHALLVYFTRIWINFYKHEDNETAFATVHYFAALRIEESILIQHLTITGQAVPLIFSPSNESTNSDSGMALHELRVLRH